VVYSVDNRRRVNLFVMTKAASASDAHVDPDNYHKRISVRARFSEKLISICHRTVAISKNICICGEKMLLDVE